MSAAAWRVFALVSLLWGSMYVVIKQALPSFSASEMVVWRFFFCGILLAPFARQHWLNWDRGSGRMAKWPGVAALGLILVVGLTGSFLPVLFTTLAQRTEPSALAGMFTALTPIMTALLAWVVLKEKLRLTGVLGLLLGLAGAALLVSSRAQAGLQGEAVLSISAGAWWFVAACFMWALTSVVIRTWLNGCPAMTLAIVSMTLLTPFSALLILFLDLGRPTEQAVAQLFSNSHAGWFWMTVLMQAVCINAYNWLILNAGAVRATTVTYAIPFVALAWGLLDGETLMPMQVLGFVGILLGMWLVGRKMTSNG